MTLGEWIEIKIVLALGTILRFFLMFYGEWQDRTQLVKYTDVDYYVFTDAAEFVTKGDSPYLRPTYRYTPILAWILQPNITFSLLFGKVIFILCDILTGYLIYSLCKRDQVEEKTAVICSCLWLLNPMPATVSSRGNAESIMSVLVLLSLKLLQRNFLIMAAVTYALSVHVKIYPVVYALQIYLYLGSENDTKGVVQFIKDFLPNRRRLIFILTAGLTFLTSTGICYYWYGWDFLHETYLYHLTRRDIRHNFSVYFYMLYLTSHSQYTNILGMLSFLPQLTLIVIFSVRYRKQTALCWFLNTFVFVTYNKVCTSQYFLWYLSLLPVIIPKIHISLYKAIAAIISWILSQGLWLLFAYYLEFEGQATFIYIWLAGVLFFLVNIWIMSVIIDGYQHIIPQDKKNK